VLSSLRQHELRVVSGTFAHPLEIIQPAATKLTESAARLTRPGTILIFHDGQDARGGPREQTVAAIGPLIDRLRDRGYRFTTVDQLLGISAYAS
jgi:peptidoglycan/xylan/chitin deacetylase (PgdA/CDA1 family)